MADILSIGISGLKAQQTALTITGNNITNAGNEGYSRQRINFAENNPSYDAKVWVGTGVTIESVNRVYDAFLTQQLRVDTTKFFENKTLANNAGQIDSLLADPGTGLQPGFERMFAAMQAAVDDPASLPAREVYISEAQGLVERFSVISDRLTDQNVVISGQMEVIAGQITSLGQSLADLNQQIAFATANAGGNSPSAMLDQRDRLLRELSELVEVRVVEQDDQSLNIFIGNGQGLVVGADSNEVVTDVGEGDPRQIDIFFQKGDVRQSISKEVSGGMLGGLLDFRETVLNPTRNNVGRLALVIGDTFNQQHQLGIDYNGLPGDLIFNDINSSGRTYARVLSDRHNLPPQDRLVSAHITDTSQLTVSDYRINFVGPDDNTLRVTRLDDNELLLTEAISAERPAMINFDGLEIRFEDGSFQKGDTYVISPTRFEADSIEVHVSRGEQLALASPILTDASLGNRGNGEITEGTVYDVSTSYFNELGQMEPPLLVRFNSATSYDVLDNTDPADPQPLFPPLQNQTFVPGIDNDIFPADEGKTSFTSIGAILPVASTYQPPAPAAEVDVNNGFAPERIHISYQDPVSERMVEQPTLVTPLHASAREIAESLSARDGIQASARSQMQLSDLVAEDGGFMNLDISLNGILLTDSVGRNQTKYSEGYPETVPEPLTLDFIAARINSSVSLQGFDISAKSDGEILTITALQGDDLQIEIRGDEQDGLSVGTGQTIPLRQAGATPSSTLSEYEGYDFTRGGPYQYEFDLPGQGSFAIELNQRFETGEELVAGIRQQLQFAGFNYAGELDVRISERGQISFQPRLPITATGPNGSSKLAIGGQIKVIVDQHYQMDIEPPGNNLFSPDPDSEPVHFGFSAKINGLMQAGDEFSVTANLDGRSDSRNGLILAALQTEAVVGGNSTFSEDYARVVEVVGATTSRVQLAQDASEVLMRNSEEAVTSVSGVILDEEAAALIKYELAYNASAQVIKVAQSIFETLISTFR